MIVYLDASALVKRYVLEPGAAEVNTLVSGAEAVATSLITRAEVAAAFGRAVRMRVLDDVAGRRAQRRFAREWPDFFRIPLSEALVARAESLAWAHGLRGYDAVQLASALVWKEALGEHVSLATFDHQLWEAAMQAGLQPWPERLAG